MTIDPNAVAPLTANVEKLNSTFTTLNTTISAFVGNFSKVLDGNVSNGIKKIQEVGNAVKGTSEAISNVGVDALAGKIGGATQAFGSFMKELNAEKVIGFGLTLKTLGDSAFIGATYMGNLTKSMKEFGAASSESSAEFLQKALPDVMKKFSEDNLKYINTLLQASDAVTGFETKLMSAATKGGQFSKVFGEGVTQSEDAMKLITKQAAEDAIRTGMSFQQSMDSLMSVVSNLPGEYQKVYNVIIGGSEQVLSTNALLTMTAKGTGVAVSEAGSIASNMKATFGSSALEASERLAMLKNVSDSLETPFDKLKGVIEDLDRSFGLWGNQMKGTVDIMNNISGALKGSNVGYEGQIAIVRNLTDSIKGLMSAQSMGMRAFIGSNMGGGMVTNALQMEKMLQEEGGIGKIASMMQQKLEQYGGGRVLTLDEAAENEGSQRQFLIQRQMLSKFGISDTGTANRLMEAMSKGDIGEGVESETGEILSKALGQAEDLQQKQVNLLQQIAVNTEAAAQMKQIDNRELVSGTIGGISRDLKAEQTTAYTKSITDPATIQNVQRSTEDQRKQVFDEMQQNANRNIIDSAKNLAAGINLGPLMKAIPSLGDSIQNQLNETKASYEKKISEIDGKLSSQKNMKREEVEALQDERKNLLLSIDNVNKQRISGLSPSLTEMTRTDEEERQTRPRKLSSTMDNIQTSTQTSPVKVDGAVDIRIFNGDSIEPVKTATLELASRASR